MQTREAQRSVPRLVLAILGVLALVLVAWILWRDVPDKPSAAVTPTAEVADREPLIAPPLEPAAVVQREAVEPTTEVPAPVASATEAKALACIRGRCLQAEDRMPLAEVTIKFHGWGRNSGSMALHADRVWADPAPVLSDAEGNFEICFDPHPGMQYSLDMEASGRVPRTGRWGTIEAQQQLELGEIELARGYEVRGRVVDESGVSIPKISVCVSGLPLPIAANMAANNMRYGHSDENGEFVVNVPIPAGTWSIAADWAGVQHRSPDQVTVLEGAGAAPVVVTVRRMPKIEGIVVDDLGEPVAGVYLNADLQRSGRMASTYTRKDGTFALYAVDEALSRVRIIVEDAKRCAMPAVQDPTEHAWGSRDVRIVLQRAKSIEIEVVERDTGKPVVNYAVRCFSENARWSNERDLRFAVEHDAGRLIIDTVSPGKNRLSVQAADIELLPSEERVILVGDEPVPLQRVELERMQRFAVRVSTAEGAAIEGAEVEVIEKGSQDLDVSASVRSRGNSGMTSSDKNFRNHEQRSMARSGVDGRAMLLAPLGERVLAVRVSHPRHPRVLLMPVVFHAEQELEVVMPLGGAIAGRVIIAGYDPGRFSVALQRTDIPPVRMSRNPTTKLDGEARFLMEGLAPGTYALKLHLQHRNFPLELNIPECIVGAGKTVEVVIDASSVAPASLSGRVLLNGAPPGAARLHLMREGGPSFGQFVPGDQGQFEAPELLPGNYSGSLLVGDFRTGEGTWLKSSNSVVLAIGARASVELLFETHRVVVHAVEEDGQTPLANTAIIWGGGRTMVRFETDANGRFVIDPAPSGKMEFFLLDAEVRPGRQTWLGAVENRPGTKEQEVTLQRGSKRKD